MFDKIITRLKNMIRIGYVSLPTTDDSGDRHIVTVSKNSKQFPVFAVYPYGFSANAPVDTSQVVCFNVGDSNANVCGIPVNQKIRFKDLKAGEVKTGNFLTTSNTYYESSGDITITSVGNLFENIAQDITITANGKMTSNITGNVEVNSQGEVKITSPSKITLQVGGATVVLTSSLLTSSVPIQAPSYSGSGGGAANMTSGINMSGQNISSVGALTTTGGVNLSTHIHSTPSGNSSSPIN